MPKVIIGDCRHCDLHLRETDRLPFPYAMFIVCPECDSPHLWSELTDGTAPKQPEGKD